ncbi:hypothetical protein [Desulfofundulus thermosubterraneus]|uniref:SH3 domain-containing protein n=1 Tax=Desulfofundulus thermosubterraneus DSM 16057 TaxID=1121432 RepID=A0A1M6JYC9_9FIRM|nr:hypothetical protein [Desulfofundulus thermosubterraneus]SHJ51673.1 hypothetical protein SAMN02745219_02737 [Desulfofundulus thermosubterraneus DSM 16057]
MRRRQNSLNQWLLAAILCLAFLSGCRAGGGQQDAGVPGPKEVSPKGIYLVASPLVVKPGDKVSVALKSDRLHEIKAELALGLSCPGIGLVKNYGRLKDNHARVKIPPDLPAGNYYFLAADPKFRVNSGVGTYAYIHVVNPDVLPADPGKAPRRLVAMAAPLYSRPEAAAPPYHTLSPGAVVRVLAVKEAAGEQWYWAQVNVYETGRERAGWLRAAATVPVTPENYRTAREVKLRPGAKYYEHERFHRGDLGAPGEWYLADEVLWIVERREKMVRLRPSEDIVLAVDGDIWAAEADLVYFRGDLREEEEH